MDQATVRARYEEFCAKVEALLVEYKDGLAPDVDDEGNDCRCEGDCDCKPPEALLATEWLFLTNYQDLETGDSVIVGIAPRHIVNSHVLGLIEYYKVSRGWA